MGGLSNGPIPDPHVLVTAIPPTMGGKGRFKVPFQLAVKRLEIDENVNKYALMLIFESILAGCGVML